MKRLKIYDWERHPHTLGLINVANVLAAQSKVLELCLMLFWVLCGVYELKVDAQLFDLQYSVLILSSHHFQVSSASLAVLTGLESTQSFDDRLV